jgi:hypothetical protein
MRVGRLFICMAQASEEGITVPLQSPSGTTAATYSLPLRRRRTRTVVRDGETAAVAPAAKPTNPRFTFIFKFDYHVRVQAALDHEHD